MNKKRNIVEWAMHYRQIVILITAILVAFGIFALDKMNKNEFPDFTVRQGRCSSCLPRGLNKRHGAAGYQASRKLYFYIQGGQKSQNQVVYTQRTHHHSG